MEVFSSCMVISEGTDIPSVGGAILMRPTTSLSLYVQMVGRAFRPAPGKNGAVILDHVGNAHRQSLPTDERDEQRRGLHQLEGELVEVTGATRHRPKPNPARHHDKASSSTL